MVTVAGPTAPAANTAVVGETVHCASGTKVMDTSSAGGVLSAISKVLVAPPSATASPIVGLMIIPAKSLSVTLAVTSSTAAPSKARSLLEAAAVVMTQVCAPSMSLSSTGRTVTVTGPALLAGITTGFGETVHSPSVVSPMLTSASADCESAMSKVSLRPFSLRLTVVGFTVTVPEMTDGVFSRLALSISSMDGPPKESMSIL